MVEEQSDTSSDERIRWKRLVGIEPVVRKGRRKHFGTDDSDYEVFDKPIVVDKGLYCEPD